MSFHVYIYLAYGLRINKSESESDMFINNENRIQAETVTW